MYMEILINNIVLIVVLEGWGLNIIVLVNIIDFFNVFGFFFSFNYK